MLLYLTKDTWTSESAGPLAKEVAEALLDGVPIILVHENDPDKGTYYILHTTYYILHTTYCLLLTTYTTHTTYTTYTTYYLLLTTYYILLTT